MALKLIVCIALIFCICNVLPTYGFINRLMNEVSQRWMLSWQRIRDQQVRPRRIKELFLDEQPMFVQTIASNDGNLDLALSALNSTKHEITLRRIRNLTNWFQNEHEYTIETIGERLGETNGVGKVDPDMIADTESSYWWVATSFYTPQNADGKISLVPVETVNTELERTPITITSDEGKSEWFYSMVDWVDMNHDGWPDIVTSRSRGHPDSIQYSELVWLENPGYRFMIWNNRQHWALHPITHGPDFALKIMRIPLASGESRLVIIGAGYWDNKLYAVWTEDPREDWTNLDAINERVIDNHGWFYQLEIADINADGRDDVVASTWSKDLQQGSVFVYEVPCNFIHGTWRRHTVLDGTADLPRPDLGSGGLITVFYPQSRQAQISRKRKPFILISGDNEGKLDVLIPNSRRTNNWEYTSHTIYRTRGPVGKVTVDDFDHDGYMEIVIPAMDQMKLVFFSYKPGPIGPEYFVDERNNFRPS